MSPSKKLESCPRCGLSMHNTPYEGYDVRICGQCWGMWLEQDKLEAILECEDEEFSQEEREQFLDAMKTEKFKRQRDPVVACPRCGEHMKKKMLVPEANLVVDSCKEHGIWLDNGELKAAQIFAEEKHALKYLMAKLRRH